MKLLTLQNFLLEIEPWANAIHEQAVAKGWWENKVDGRAPGTVIFLMVTELAEAFEIYRMPDKELTDIWQIPSKENPEVKKPEGYPVELADVIIRCLDHIAALAPSAGGSAVIQTSAIDATEDVPTKFDPDCGEIMIAVTKMLMGVHSSFFHPESSTSRNRRRAIRGLLGVVVTLLAYGEHKKLDLPEAIALKHAYNGTRPMRHGGKRA